MSNPTTPIHRAPLSQQHRRVITTTSPDAIGAQVSVVIDGVEAKVPFGVTILEAAKNAGVKIPTLCDHPDLDVAGVCRMCVVEVEGQRTLQPACTFPVVNQMKVNTHSRKVRMARKHVLELLLSEHCGECYSCVRNGNCELQTLAEEYGITELPLRAPRGAAVRAGQLELQRHARHEQVHPLPPLHPHLHRHPGSRRARGRRPQQQGHHRDLRGHAARHGRLHQLRPVRQPLPGRRPVRQGRDRRGVGRASTTPTSTSSSRRPPRRARPWASCSASSPARRSPSR